MQLAQKEGEFYADPLGFVLFNFPWGQAGTRLAKQDGPDDWQIECLTELGRMVAEGISIAEALPVLMAIASGHGIGKTALIAWIILWFITTREHPQIIVTAGKKEQLTGKTWRELAKWKKLALCGHWFHWTATKLEHVLFPDTWYAQAIPWSKNAPENFAGTHEEHVLVIFDEASAVDDLIWEVTDGAMTTPGAMWIAFGNPTRTTGRFAQCFGKFKHRWWTRHIDSRTAKMANKAYLQQMVEDYGEDSDFVRVRVRGLFPRAGNLQFIDLETVAASFRREAKGYEESGKVMAVDIARHGDDQSTIFKRQGNKSYKIKRYRISDLMLMASIIAEEIDEWKPDIVFVDATGMGWGVVDRLHQLGYDMVIGVQTGEASDEPERFKNKRAEIWYKMREWIKNGGCLVEDKELESELTEPEYGFDDRQRYVLEAKKDMKARDLASPDGADAVALSFTSPVAPTRQKLGTWRDRLKKQRRRSAMAA
ncbi:MAG: terminase [Pseudomonadota bacterium]